VFGAIASLRGLANLFIGLKLFTSYQHRGYSGKEADIDRVLVFLLSALDFSIG